MRFEYQPYDGSLLPLVPVAFSYGERQLPAVRCLVDTGTTHSILPMEVAEQLGVSPDLLDGVEATVAGGGHSHVYLASDPIACLVRDPNGSAEYRWSAPVLFSVGQRVVLLGHHQCLEKFDVTLLGPERVLDMTARFRTESTERPRRRER